MKNASDKTYLFFFFLMIYSEKVTIIKNKHHKNNNQNFRMGNKKATYGKIHKWLKIRYLSAIFD